MIRVRSWWATLAGSLVILAGCSHGEPPGVSVHGEVSADGQPLSCATISWLPEKSTSGTKQTVLIHQGRYEVPPENHLSPGWYRIRVAMLPPEMIEAAIQSNPQLSTFRDRIISPEFDSQSRITHELVAEQDNTFDITVGFLK
jgi:hypothetical protein